MISDIEHDILQKSEQKYIKKTHLGVLTETYEILLRLIKITNIHVFKKAAPTVDRFPKTIL